MNDFDWLRKRFYYELEKGYLRGMENKLKESQKP